MQEKQVTIGRETHHLEKLFLVLATQNPIEISGTYLLPEAEIDRFMFKIKIRYPSYNDEIEITEKHASGTETPLAVIFKPEEILALRTTIAEWLPPNDAPSIIQYIARLVRATRPEENDGILEDLVMYGASPRATIALTKASRVYAYIQGDDTILPEHVQKMAYPVLRHRIILTHEAEVEGYDSDDIITKILHRVPILE